MIDLNTMLQLQITGYSKRVKSVLTGKENDRYLLVKTPPELPLEALRRGTRVVVRYVYEGSIYGFESNIILPIGSPINALFIKFPEEVEDHNLRTHKRFECHLPTRLKIKKSKDGRELIFRGISIDISKGGCKTIVSQAELEWVDEPVKLNSEIELFVAVPGVQEKLKFSGFVRNIAQDQNDLALGIQFSELIPRTATELQKYLAVYQK
jgi:c-di-GMP-binding flagellar brake protein YcgR